MVYTEPLFLCLYGYGTHKARIIEVEVWLNSDQIILQKENK